MMSAKANTEKSQRIVFSEKEYKFMIRCVEAEYTVFVETLREDSVFKYIGNIKKYEKDYLDEYDTDEEKLKVLEDVCREIWRKEYEFEEYEKTIEKMCRKLKCSSHTEQYGEILADIRTFIYDMNDMKDKMRIKIYEAKREARWAKQKK